MTCYDQFFAYRFKSPCLDLGILRFLSVSPCPFQTHNQNCIPKLFDMFYCHLHEDSVRELPNRKAFSLRNQVQQIFCHKKVPWLKFHFKEFLISVRFNPSLPSAFLKTAAQDKIKSCLPSSIFLDLSYPIKKVCVQQS